MSAPTLAPVAGPRDVACPARGCAGHVGMWCGTKMSPREDGFHDTRWQLADRVTEHLAALQLREGIVVVEHGNGTVDHIAAALPTPVDLDAARTALREALQAATRRGRLHQALTGEDPALDAVVAAMARGGLR